MNLKKLFLQNKKFEREAHKILGVHETSKSRILTVEQSYEKLNDLSIEQDDLFRQAIRCVEEEIYRSAHVMVWAAFIDFLENKLLEDGGNKIRNKRPNWKVKTVDDLRDVGSEYQIVEAGRDVGLYPKTLMKALHGLLNKRNECAHPSDYYPELNDTLGYISELIGRIKHLQGKSLNH